jgi:hypothetical protein
MDHDHKRLRGRLGLAMLGISLALAVPLGAWSGTAGGATTSVPAEAHEACLRPLDADGLAVFAQAEVAAAQQADAALIGFPCASKLCLICEENGGICASIPSNPQRCTCQ